MEIHACHGYLLGEFLSPLTNRRTDEYGGSLQNRLRLLIDCINILREAIGVDIVVGVRISGDEFTPGGLTIDDSKLIAKALEDIRDLLQSRDGNVTEPTPKAEGAQTIEGRPDTQIDKEEKNG